MKTASKSEQKKNSFSTLTKGMGPDLHSCTHTRVLKSGDFATKAEYFDVTIAAHYRGLTSMGVTSQGGDIHGGLTS